MVRTIATFAREAVSAKEERDERQRHLNTIERMVEEEHRLLNETSKEGASPELHARLAELQVSLDQSWDLLRQRRAKREFGQDPASAEPRDATTVERYDQ